MQTDIIEKNPHNPEGFNGIQAGDTCCSVKKQCCSKDQKKEDKCCSGEKKEDKCCSGTKKEDTCCKTDKDVKNGCCNKDKKADQCCQKNMETPQQELQAIAIDVVEKSSQEDGCKDGCCPVNKDEQKEKKPVLDPNSKETRKWILIALVLSIFTIVWNIAEGVISLIFGFEEETIALGIFGTDSLIEVASGFVVFWRFKNEFLFIMSSKNKEQKQQDLVNEEQNIRKERIATRIIGFLLFFLALGALAGSIINLVQEKGADNSVPGLIISGVSISFMFFLYWIKLKAAKKLNDNKTLYADAKCSLSCIVLSLVLFVGSLIAVIADGKNADVWWLDSSITIVMGLLIIKEGVEAIIYSFSKDFQGGCPCCPQTN